MPLLFSLAIHDALVAVKAELRDGDWWNRSGVSPPNVEDLGEQVWNPAGIKVLGTPVGSDQFVSDVVAERVQEETRLWEAVVGARFAGCLALTLANSRSVCRPEVPPFVENTAPELQSSEYALLHDAGMLRAMKSLLGGLPGEPQRERRCLSPCHSAHANGRVGSQVSDPDGSSRLLGLVG